MNATRGDPGPSLDDKVEALRAPQAYPEPTAEVDAIETHNSWVFLTDTRAYKLKKPTRSRHFDFTTLDRRRRNCELELALNRRLARDVYLAILPLTSDRGRLRLSGGGPVVEWLVAMKRLPTERMLDTQIALGSVSSADVRRAVERLVRFYETAERVTWTGDEYRRRLAEEIDDCERELAARGPVADAAHLPAVIAAQRAMLIDRPGLFDARVRAGRIVDGHGDLRPEHICLLPEPVIIDCLEFSRELRQLDTAAELAFLDLECGRLGAPELGELVRETYRELSGDHPESILWELYASMHACIRAKLSLAQDGEPDGARRDRRRDKGAAYLRLAERLTRISEP